MTKQDNGDIVPDAAKDGWRRAIYVLKKRRSPVTMLEVFDAPQLSPNCTERVESNVAPQALHLTNGSAVLDHARYLAGRLIEQYPGDRPEQIDRLYEQVLARPATEQENADARDDLVELTAHWESHLENTRYNGPRPPPAQWMALGSVVHGLLNSPEFVYID